MALPNIILPPEMTPVGSVRAELIGSGGTAAMQEEGESVGVRLLRELISVSKDMAENLNVLADIAKMQLEEAKKLAFAMDESAIEAGRQASADGGTTVDLQQAGNDEKKGILDNLPFLMFGAGGLAGALAGFFKALGLAGLMGVVAYALGDDLNKYITELTGNEDMGKVAEFILYGTAASPIISAAMKGKKFAGIRGLLIGAVIGLVVGLVDLFESKVEEGTGSALLGDLTAALTGALGGAAVGLMVAGPAGIIPGLIIGLAVSAIKSLYDYFTNDENKQKIDEEFGKVEDVLNQASQWIIDWVQTNLVDPVRKFLGLSTSADKSDSRVQAIDEKIAAAEENLESVDEQRDKMYTDAQALRREANAQPSTKEGRAERDRLLDEASQLDKEANTLSKTAREDIRALKSERSDILQTVADERNAATTEPEVKTASDYLQLGDGPMSMARDPSNPGGVSITPTPSATGQTAAMASQAAATTSSAPVIISAPQTRGGDTYNTNMQKTIVASDPSNYDDSIIRSMRNNYTLD